MILRYSGPRHFDCRLRQAASPSYNEFQWLNDHSLAATTCKLLPPTSGLLNALRVGYIDLFVRRGKQKAIANLAKLSKLFHMPGVIPLDMNLPFRSEQVKRGKL
jgi:hypothetical protein